MATSPTVQKFIEPKGSVAMNNFLAELNKDGGALPSRYEVIISSPGHGDSRKVSMRCEAIDLPGRNLNTAPDSNIYGIAPEIVDGVMFGGTIAMTFQASSDLEERVFFESWQELAWDKGTWNVGYYKDYIKVVDIYILDINNKRRYGLRLMECYPKEIGASSLSYTEASDIIKIPISMQYRYWETLDITNQPPNLIEKTLDTAPTGATRTINANIPNVVSRMTN